METPTPVPEEPARTSLAEEQRRAFEEDRRRQRRLALPWRWPGFLFRN